MTKIITYGDHSVDLDALPEVSLIALARRGLAHYLGNEVSSKHGTQVEAHDKAGTALNDGEKAALKTELQLAAVAALNAGTVGANIRGPRGTAIDTLIRQIAEKEIREVLKTNGLTFPSGDKVVTFANGETRTRAELIGNWVTKHTDRLTKLAETEQKNLARMAAKVKSEAGESATVESLGL